MRFGQAFLRVMMLQESKIFVSLVVWLGTALFSYAKIDFQKEILPILETKCWNCHQAPSEKEGKVVKPKAGLRLDADWAILKGGESGLPGVTPKEAGKSYVLEVVSLPKDDDMFMPPKGEPLTVQEVAKLKVWIEEGADFGDWKGSDVGRPAKKMLVEEDDEEREHEVLYRRLEQGLEAVEPKVLKTLQEQVGAQVQAMGPQSVLLRVDFLTGVAKCNDEKVAGLGVIGDHVAQLDLARTKVSDEAMKVVAQMPRLLRLDLRQTAVTDEGLRNLSGHKELRALNLFGTKVSDAGVEYLGKLKSLREVYLTETAITAEGVSKLRRLLPEAEVVGGKLDVLLKRDRGDDRRNRGADE